MSNQQSLFISKTGKRQSSQYSNDSKNLIKSRNFFTLKPSNSASSNSQILSQNQTQTKYKGLSLLLNQNNISNFDKKPIFRITSVSQNQYSTKEKEEQEVHNEIRRSHFSYQMVIGKGGFGKVWICEHRQSKKYYALKEMSKAKIISKRSVQSVLNERAQLTQYQHNFIVNMKYAFQDRQNQYLVMDLLTGGDLRFHICFFRRFSEEQTKFFCACIVQGLEFTHTHSILHRDIKPENLVFEESGYLRITDFGIARKWNPENAKETSGTPGYMAPEVMCRQNHGMEVDYFALGVICYECMLGKRPYLGRSRKEIRDQILAKQIQIKIDDIPKGWSIEAADFINRQIQRKPAKRQGSNGPAEIKAHPWLKTYPWDKLQKKEIEPPFKPNTKNVFDYAKHLSEEDSEPDDEVNNNMLLRRKSVQDQFDGYFHETKYRKPQSSRQTINSIRRKSRKTNSVNISSNNND